MYVTTLPCPVAHSARSCCQGSLPPPHRWPWGDVVATSPFPLPGSCRIVPAAPSPSIFQPCCCNHLLPGTVPPSAPSHPSVLPLEEEQN